ncbi:MAG: carbohydrate ABC transporter permease [Armatimonadota bacterium]
MFCAPALVGLVFLLAYPIVASLYYSFCRYSVIKPPVWVGTANYASLVHDSLFWKSLWNTVVYAAFAVPLGMIVAFCLALLLNLKVRGMAFYRTLFFVPSIVPIVASSALWLWLLNPQYGLINAGLGSVGIEGPGWLASPAWTKPALILMSAWGVGSWMLIYLAGLQDVPEELYEAADLDGASTWHKLRHITLPMMSPHILFTLIVGLIGAFQLFTNVWIMTNGTGGVADSALFYSLYLFQNAFSYFKMGKACAMAWVLFLLIVGATALVFRTSARYVYYRGGE